MTERPKVDGIVEQREFEIDTYAPALQKALDQNDMTLLRSLAQTIVEKSKIWRRDRALSWCLSAKATERYSAWSEENRKTAAAAQLERAREKGPEALAETERRQRCCGGGPYTGAIGGSVTFFITPTSIGDIITAEDSMTGAKIDFYDDVG